MWIKADRLKMIARRDTMSARYIRAAREAQR